MNFYVFTTPDGIHYRHCEPPYSVAILDDTMSPISAEFQPIADDYDCVGSFGAGLVAVGYWRTADLRIYDLHSGEERRSFPFRKLETMIFDDTGRKLLFKSGSQVFLLDLKTGEAMQVRGLLALDRHVSIKGRNEVLVALQKKGELLRLALRSGRVTVVPLPIDATFFDLQLNPSTGRVVLIDRKKSVHCLDTSKWKLVWSLSLKKQLGKDHMGVGQFSGDGTLYGAAVAARDHNYTIVIDAEKGEIKRRIESGCEGLPWRGSIIREDSTRANSFVAHALDLSSGEESEVSLLTNGA